jgi:2-desacetyl-2-hydroxyethyl bacteriochlorophyllide A dehydrogenase
MRIASLHGPKHFELLDEADPGISRDDVLLRVAACGVCTSELDMWRGASGHSTYPWYPGHEVSGVVERVGPEVQWPAPGDEVAAWVTTRGFAERVAVRAEYCVPAAGVPLDVALAEPLACSMNAVDLAGVALGDDVVVIGAGFMGLLIAQLAALRGPRHLVVADVRDEALARASALGATRVVNVNSASLVDAVREVTDGQGADVTIEATGAQEALSVLGDVTRMSGTIVIAGYHQGEPRTIPLAQWNWMAFRIANAHFREVATIMRGMRAGMRLLSAGRVRMDDLVTHRFGLDDIDAAFRTALDKPPGFVKATVIP